MFPFLYSPMIPNLKKLWNDFDQPPTVYALLNSYVNYENPNPVKIAGLAKAGRSMFFDFDYPLAEGWNKEDFETMILNHFMMRRIGYETLTAFKLALNVKLNEVMPEYNRLYKSINGWDLFKDGESIIRDTTDNGSSTGSQNISTSGSSSNTSDRRFSDTPQNAITDVRDGTYVTDYNYDQNSSIESNSTLASNSNTNSNATHETITRTPSDKIRIYNEFLTARQNLYTMIFKDLESLFYQIALI